MIEENIFQVGTVTVPNPPGGLYPAVGMHSDGEEVRLNLDAEWQYEELVHMAVDSGEEEWSRLHDVKLNGMVSTWFSQIWRLKFVFVD